MTWTVFVTWGCQLGGGNEKECMSMVPPNLGAPPAKRGTPAARMPTAAPASTSRRVNGAPPAGTTVPASETNKAMILLLEAPLMEPCGQSRPGMPACQHYLSESSREPRRCVRAANGGYHPALGDPGGVSQCRKKGMCGRWRRPQRVTVWGGLRRFGAGPVTVGSWH